MASIAGRVACIGECMIELCEPSPGNVQRGYGGDTLNTAVYIARWMRGTGIDVAYVTALGDDPFSDEMIAGWLAEGVSTEHVQRLPGRLPGLYAIRTDHQGERSFHYWRSAAAAREMLGASGRHAVENALEGSDLIYLSGISLGILDPEGREVLLALLGRARQRGARIAVDTNYRPRNWSSSDEARSWIERLFRGADVALPTFDDERTLFGDASQEATAERLHGWGVEEVVVKHGALPCLVSWPEGRQLVPALSLLRPVVDSTAAGDSFNAAYLGERLVGTGPVTAAERGHVLASRVICRSGALIPQADMPQRSVP